VVTAVLDYVGLSLFPSAYADWAAFSDDVSYWGHPVAGVLTALTFTNELWFAHIAPLSDMPVWSLGFEAWYYALFGALHYLRGVQRVIVAGVCAIIAGPKLLLLLPVWWLGVLSYRAASRTQLRPLYAWSLGGFALALYVVTRALHPYQRAVALEQRWFGAGFVSKLSNVEPFLYCYVIGMVVALSFFAAASLQDPLQRILSPAANSIRRGARSTFSIYLFHFPILLFTTAATGTVMHPGPARSAICVAVTLAICFALGSLFDETRMAWREVFKRMLSPHERQHPLQ
jgi:peptidoglycan/LPS O-acetylase OafA/YrhL